MVKSKVKVLDAQEPDDTSVSSGKLFFFIIGAIILVVVIFAVLLHVNKPEPFDFQKVHDKTILGQISESENNYLYNGFAFVRENTSALWQTVVYKGQQPYTIATFYSPRQLENIPFDDTAYKIIIPKSKIFLSLNSSLDDYESAAAQAAQGAIEVGKVIGKRFGMLSIDTASTVTFAQEGSNIPVSTCENATNKTGVIVFSLGNITQVTTQGDCVLVDGITPDDIIRASDRLMFNIIGVMRLPSNSSQ